MLNACSARNARCFAPKFPPTPQAGNIKAGNIKAGNTNKRSPKQRVATGERAPAFR
jgi:hypothetical protein